jgi:hypothetical protein
VDYPLFTLIFSRITPIANIIGIKIAKSGIFIIDFMVKRQKKIRFFNFFCICSLICWQDTERGIREMHLILISFLSSKSGKKVYNPII